MSNDPHARVAPGDWQSYICKVNGELASVFVDLSLRNVAPISACPKLVWLWIRLIQPRADGLSSDAEFDALCDFDDDLEASIVSSGSCIYAGRITSKGRREFYFYVADELDLTSKFDDVLRKHSQYAFQLGERRDESWNHLIFTLMPGPHGLDQIKRRKSHSDSPS